MKFKRDQEPTYAGTPSLSSIGMMARAALSTAILLGSVAAQTMPSPQRQAAPADAPMSESASPLATSDDLIRVRVSQMRANEFTLSGDDVTIGRLSVLGYHAYKLKSTVSRGGTVWRVTDRDTLQQVAAVPGRTLKVSGHMLRLNLKPVPNQIEISSRENRTSDVIAEIGLETYLRGVLPAEMPSSWPIEALKAQAIAARTFALFRKAHQNHEGYDLDSDVMDQMFVNPLKPDDKLTANADRAIRETNGVTLKDRKQKIFAAYFHADCGGQTEEAKDVWGTGERLGTATDGGCPLNPKASWTLKLTTAQLARRLKERRVLSDLQLTARTPSGRAAEIVIAWTDGSTQRLMGNEFRRRLGFDQLKSTQFTVAKDGNAFVFKGRGFGHGVGLCQWGARQMAKGGRGYKEILAHYYPQAHLAQKAPLGFVAQNLKSTSKLER